MKLPIAFKLYEWVNSNPVPPRFLYKYASESLSSAQDHTTDAQGLHWVITAPNGEVAVGSSKEAIEKWAVYTR